MAIKPWMAALPLLWAGAGAYAAYPCPVLKIVSPYPPGGTTDILARLLAPGLGKELGVSTIVENRGGASSNIGTEFVARAAGDGCTLLLGNNTGVVINRNLYKLNVDPVKDLAPVAQVAVMPLVLYVNADFPAKTVGELVAEVQKHPGKYNYASGGSGSPQHLAGELLKLQKNLDLTHVPYRGQGPALADVLAGQVPIAFETTSALASHLAGGRLRPLATTGTERAASLPQLPTMIESGFADFVVTNWYGVFAPAKTPRPLLDQLSAAVNAVLATKETADKLASLGSTSKPVSAQAFAAFVTADVPYWESVVKRSGAKVD